MVVIVTKSKKLLRHSGRVPFLVEIPVDCDVITINYNLVN